MGGGEKRGKVNEERTEKLTAVLVRPNALVPALALGTQHAHVRVLDNLELVLLVPVKVLVEGVAWQLDGLGYQAREIDRDVAHALHVLSENGPEVGEHLR
jgi:hypothetical protein